MKEDLIARARRVGAPLIDGNQVTFVWRGKRAPQLMGDFNAWAGSTQRQNHEPLNLIPHAPGVWKLTLEFPQNAYIEYSFITPRGRVNDPLNARTTPNGFGASNNYFYMPGVEPTPYAEKRPGIARGRVTTHTVTAPGMVVGNTRKIHLYAPPAQGPVPLLVAFDGQDYLKRARLPLLLDNLIADKKIPPVAAAMLESAALAGGSARMAEYAMNELTLLLLLQQVLPLAQNNLKLLSWKQAPGAHAVLGASMGGLMAVFTALRAPQVFGTAVSQAAPFDLYNTRSFVFDLTALPMPHKPRVHLDAGRIDVVLQSNRRLSKHLRAQNFSVEYREYYAAHNWPAWRNALPGALIWTFGS